MFVLKELTFIFLCVVLSQADNKPTHENHRSVLAKNLENLRNQHREEIASLKQEMIQLRKEFHTHCVGHPIRHGSIQERNMKLAIEETQQDLSEIRAQVSEANEIPKANVTDVHKHLQALKKNMNRIMSENSRHASHVRTLEARIEKMDGVMQRLRYDKKIIENTLGELRSQLSSISKQVKQKILEVEEEANGVSNNVEEHPQDSRKHRHVKLLHTQLQRLSRAHDQLEMGHQSIQAQLSDHQSRLVRLEKPNWDVITAKLDYLDIQTKSINHRLANNTPSSDVNKMHASILELREDLEAVENKMDKVTPEFRKEISKLDVDQAQMNAHFSYVKQDVENLRQSVRAIAVSMSNTQDRAAQNREEVKRVSDAVESLTAQTKNHFYRLNDYILKSEANPVVAATNLTEIIPLPELMGEVKELQPVEREYQDLVAQLPKDCSNVTEPPGIYIIRPGQDTVNAWCANGTTLIQRRFNGSVEFNHLFPEYVQGFGDLTSEYWVGLETMHRLTADNCTSMRIDMTDIFGASWYAEYESFYVGGAETGYVLRVSGFSGNASDAFEYQNHMEFSTIDRDRDISNTHCAANYEGGWWFSHCQHVNINGKYTLGLTWFDSTHNEWIAVATSEMRVFRRPGCF